MGSFMMNALVPLLMFVLLLLAVAAVTWVVKLVWYAGRKDQQR